MFAAKNFLLTPSSTVQAVTFQGTPNVSNTTSVTIPSHSANQIIIILARNSTTYGAPLPTIPSASGTVPTFTGINTATTGDNWANSRVSWAVASAGNHTSGTWSNTTAMMAIVLSGNKTSSPIGGQAASAGTSQTSFSAPSITMSQTNGSSAILHLFSAGSAATLWSTWSETYGAAPSGYTQRSTANYANDGLCLDSKDVTTSDGACSQTINGSFTIGYLAHTIEILAP